MARAGRGTEFEPEIDAFENGKAVGLFSIRFQASGNLSLIFLHYMAYLWMR